MKGAKHAAFTAALVLLVALACLAMSEAVLRLTVYNFKPYPVSPGAGAAYHVQTAEFDSLVTTNSLNMRDGEIPPKREGEYRVLCLGDSFTFGLGVNVPDSYPKVLERLLRERDPKYTSINGGTGGNAATDYEFLVQTGFGFKPDLVVVQIYVGNDFYDGLERLEGSGSSAPAAAPAPKAPGLVASLKERVRGLKLRTFEFLWIQLTKIPSVDDLLYRLHLRYDNRAIYLREYPALEEKLVALELADLKTLKDACDARGMKTLFLIVPEKQQVFQKKYLENDRYDYEKPDRILKEFCAKNGAPVIDLLDQYAEMPPSEVRRFYFSKDQHWTAAGHYFTATALAARILEDARK